MKPMLKISHRPLTQNEIKSLKRNKFSNFIGDVEMIIGSFAFFTGIFIIPLLIYGKFYPVSSRIQDVTTIIILIIVPILTGIIFWKFKMIHYKPTKRIEEIIAEIWHIKTHRVIKREDPEDFGVGFYIDITDKVGKRKVLFLWGQYMDMLEFDKKFPNTEFKVIKRSDTKQILDIEVCGNYFEPEKTIPFFSEEDWQSGNYHEDGEIIEMSIDGIV